MSTVTKWLRRITGRKKTTAANPSSPATMLPGVDPFHCSVIAQVRPYTMTSPERIIGLCDAVQYVIDNRIPGDFVECGVWRGGSAMAIALVLKANQIFDRQIWLYDTFNGMTPPTDSDVDCFGLSADQLLSQQDRNVGESVWCVAQMEQVRTAMASTGYPLNRVHFIQGPVEQTIPQHRPREIALLRLDTDWYESTKHELEHLYPILEDGAPLIIDDYGHWQGCRAAIDEYFARLPIKPFLHRLDYTGRIAIKPRSEVNSSKRRLAG